ncbi:Arf-GAP domain and FG repeats-containing protein 1 [Entomortierella parvispora]|uniref:Arf-GAP domain and FG repeats-containing protein 1 n=1 Tax=Entomortierella parvispora TaxID=205924 RepID=A0A9P3H3L8_9FUNG|nr:Arf-GAP domain and FG repeats-containing protein 1 [Entomortierella parvispora]
MSRRLDDKHSRILTGLLKLPENKKCFDCPSKVNVYANLFNSTFICERCSGLHRELNHRVKSISASTFTPEEVAGLQKGGNAAAKRIWLATWSWREYPEPDAHDMDELRQFMRAKYVKKLWFVDPHTSAESVSPAEARVSQPSSTTCSPTSLTGAATTPTHDVVAERMRAIAKSQSIDGLNNQSSTNTNISSPTSSTHQGRTLSRKSSTISSDSGSTTLSKSTDLSSVTSSPFNPAGSKQSAPPSLAQQQYQQQGQQQSQQQQQPQQQQQQQRRPSAPQQSQWSFDNFMGVMSPGAATPMGQQNTQDSYAFPMTSTPAAVSDASDPFSLATNAFSNMSLASNNTPRFMSASPLTSPGLQQQQSFGYTQQQQQQQQQQQSQQHSARPILAPSTSSMSSSDFFANFSTPSLMTSPLPAQTNQQELQDPFSLSAGQNVQQKQQSPSDYASLQGLDFGVSNGMPATSAYTSVNMPTIGATTGARSFDDYLSALGQGRQQPQQQQSGNAFGMAPTSSSAAPAVSSYDNMFGVPAMQSPPSNLLSGNPFGLQQPPVQSQPLQQTSMPSLQRAQTAPMAPANNPFAMFAKQVSTPPVPAIPTHFQQQLLSDPFGNASKFQYQQQQQQQQQEHPQQPQWQRQPQQQHHDYFSAPLTTPSSSNPFAIAAQQGSSASSPFY